MEIKDDLKYKTELVPIELKYKGKTYAGEARPLRGSCEEGVCFELDVNLNGEHLGTIHSTKSGWTMDKISDQEFIHAIGEQILLWYG
jgi:hypothetical protein